jgi:hypothetical protein
LFSIRNGTLQRSRPQVTKWKAVGRVAALLLLLVAMTGPWLIDTHPATEESCSAPLVWLGDGQCACLVSFVASWAPISADQSPLWVMLLLPTLPFLSTMLLILGRGQRYLWIFHLFAWGLTAVFSLFIFILVIWSSHFLLSLWGAGTGGMLAVAVLAGEILTAKRLPDRPSRRVAA